MESPQPRRDFPFFRFYAENRLKIEKKGVWNTACQGKWGVRNGEEYRIRLFLSTGPEFEGQFDAHQLQVFHYGVNEIAVFRDDFTVAAGHNEFGPLA